MCIYLGKVAYICSVTFENLRQEDYCKFKASLGYIRSLQATLSYRPCLKKQNEQTEHS